MRFPSAALFFLIASFIFFCIWAVTSYLLSTVSDAITPLSTDFMSSSQGSFITLLPIAFGIICIVFFLVGILLIFVLDSLADEPEMYWRE